jgi:translation initiation factor IF-3
MSMIMNLKERTLKFFKEGAKLKLLYLKGRSIIYKDQGQILLRLATDLEEFGKVEAMPVLEGKRMIMFIALRRKIGSHSL